MRIHWGLKCNTKHSNYRSNIRINTVTIIDIRYVLRSLFYFAHQDLISTIDLFQNLSFKNLHGFYNAIRIGRSFDFGLDFKQFEICGILMKYCLHEYSDSIHSTINE